VIVYRDSVREEETGALLGRALAYAAEGDAASLLVEVGVVEQALVDALRPSRDGWGEADALLREAALLSGGAYLVALDGRPAAPLLRRAREALERVRGWALPERVRARAPEGYVHYALSPAGYAAAARDYLRAAGEERARRAVVIGVRSIGTSLAAVVAAALGSPRRLTLRPRGESGSRRLDVDDALAAHLSAVLTDGGDVLLVDEGPGATGETFQCTARWLEGCGVAAERIVLFPSHTGGMALAPEERRAWFAAARKHPPPVEGDRGARVAAKLGLSRVEDLSAGRWREVVAGAEDAPSCVGFERVKYLAEDGQGRKYLVRYAGLGRWGRETVERAWALAELGAGAEVRGFAEGFLALRWIEGTPAGGEARRDRRFVEALTRYLEARAGRFRTGEPVDVAPMVGMLRENAAEVLGEEVAGLDEALRRLERLPEREAVIPDARLALREWIRTRDGYVKVDALDHGDGMRFPGPTDAAWDLAGAAVEHCLPAPVLNGVVRRVAALSGESGAELSEAVAAYRAPYVACCMGDAYLSAWEAHEARDRVRWEAEAERYRKLLARELRRAFRDARARRAAALPARLPSPGF
jgi:hypothetical protein